MEEPSEKGGRPYGSDTYGSGAYGNNYIVAATETKEGQERIRKYHEALGRFVDAYSEVEITVHLTLRHYARTPSEIANIAFASVKTDVGMTFIKQMAKATGYKQDVLNDLEDMFGQLGVINGARNHIFHYGAEKIAEGQGYVTNAIRAKGEPTTFPISPELLEAMWQDLQKIVVRLNYWHLGRPRPKSIIVAAFIDGVAGAPWRYKYQALPPSGPK